MYRVLYIDDEPDLLELVKIVLEETKEFIVHLSTNATEILKSDDLHSYDVIISDYEMPDINGITFLKEVRLKFGNIPFILFTGRGREQVVIEAINNGADFYLQKGGDPQSQFAELIHKIRMAVKRKHAEDGENKSEERFRSLIETSPDMIWEIDTKGIFTYISPQIKENLGYLPINIIGKSIFSIINPDNISEIGNKFNSHLIDKTYINTLEVPTLHFNSTIHIIEIRSKSIIGDNGKVLGFRGTARDVTSRKKIEEELFESEAKFRNLAESINDGITRIDRNHRHQYVNQAMKLQTGINIEDFINKTHRELGFPATISDESEKMINYVFDTGNKKQIEFLLPNGIWVEILTVPEFSSNGEISHVIMTGRDITERKRMEKALKESEERYRQIIETAQEGIWILDTEYHIVSVNPYMAELLEYNQIEMEGRPLTDFIDKDEFSNHEFISGERRKGISGKFERLYRTKRGKKVWGLVSSTPIFKDNVFVGAFAMVTDITKRKMVEEELKRSRDSFITVFQHNPIPLTLVSTVDGTFVDVNEPFLQETGYTKEEVVGKTSGDLKIFAEVHEYLQITTLLKNNLQISGIEVHCQRKNGEVRICRFSSKTIIIDGKPHILSSIEDITERKKAEIALIESENRFKTIIEKMPVPLGLINQDGKTVYCNSAFLQIFGYSGNDLNSLENWWLKAYPDEIYRTWVLRTWEEDITRAKLEQTNIEPREYRITCKNGVERNVIISGILLEENILATFFDITEFKQIEQSLSKANNELHLLGSMTRHDILNQVIIILGYVNLLKRKELIPPLDEYCKKIESASHTIQNQIAFTKMYLSLQSHKTQWLDIEDMLQRLEMPESIKLNSNISGFQIFVEPIIEKIFFNLLDNSIRHGQCVTRIDVYVNRTDEEATIVWEDNGEGISASDKKHIFKSGFGKNTGYGLFLIKEILSLSRMTIKETGIPGKGARFEITVPNGIWRLKVK